ncbi:MAG: hypothetical protein ICV78_19530 [Tolypothrix sp. Co-bin9]|nr:hypothetical protein [Tolypothrix sp. Co-bin9]
MLGAIAFGEVVVSHPKTPRPEAFFSAQIEAIKAAIKYFTDINDFEKVYILASLLREQ